MRHKKLVHCGVYCIENLITGYCYWGQSINVDKRLINHRSALNINKHGNKHMQCSFNKHGIVNFTFKVMVYCESWEMTRYEDMLEKAHRPLNYNKRDCADSNKGMKHSEETRLKISKSNKGHIGYTKGTHTAEETKHKISDALKGSHSHKVSEALMGNQRAKGKPSGNKGHHMSDEGKSRLSALNTGKIMSAEARMKIGKASKDRQSGDIFKGKVPWNKGIKATEEAKHNMSEAQKLRRLRRLQEKNHGNKE